MVYLGRSHGLGFDVLEGATIGIPLGKDAFASITGAEVVDVLHGVIIWRAKVAGLGYRHPSKGQIVP